MKKKIQSKTATTDRAIPSDREVSTILSTALLKREHHQSPITETDLENYIVEAVTKCFHKSRLEIASKANISEFDLLLRDARIMGFKIDGHKVINPEGFTGKTLEVLTLVTIIKKSFSFFKGSGMAEEGSLRAHILSSQAGSKLQEEALIYTETCTASTTVFASTPTKTWRIGEVAWGKADILNTIKEFFQTDEASSEKIYKRFINQELSPAIADKLENIFRSSFKVLISGVSNVIESARRINRSLNISFVKSISINAFDSFALPADLDSRRFLFNGKRVKIIDTGTDVDTAGFLAGLDASYKRYNDIVKTRIKWLRA